MNKDEMFEKEAMYVSPITVAIHEIQRNYNSKVDTLILEEIHKYDVKVDKDELIKALKYDRNQYEKGYADGKKETATEIVWWLICFCGGITPPINDIADKYGIDAYALRKRKFREGVEQAMKEGGECPCINLDELE